jgi:uncharacterized protein (DUF1697 family)
MKYIALLRGINVGGNNIVKMVDLCECFERAGYQSVSTYIQSGNVIFDTKRTTPKTLEDNIEALLKKRFNFDKIVVVVLASEELAEIAHQAPSGFGKRPDLYRYDVIFLKRPLVAEQAASQIPKNVEVDTITAGKHAIYTTRLIAKATSSRLSKMATLTLYQSLTIRNWNTATKLLELST